MNPLIVYRNYRDSDAEGLVRMWNESLSGWPPGFFGASAITAASVAREEKSSGRLFTVLALLEERVVGFCRTSPYGGELNASYVDIINVVPDMHGRGIGKALLLDSVSRSVEFGMTRIDLHTWSANMKAVPLYKKAGYFWVPETMVYMQNYMPFLLGRREFLDFLEGEDWYSCFERALLVEQDAEKTDSGREIFTYVFRRNDKKFTAEFDKSGRVLSRMEYPGFSAGLSVDSGQEYFVGRSCKLTLSGSGFDAGSVSVDCGSSVECTEAAPGAFLITVAGKDR